MKTLYLMRHAKASQNMFGVSDIDRPLLTEGIEDSRRMAFHLMDLHIKIKHIVSSPAKRALSTAEVVAHAFNIETEDILVYDELYKADIPAFEDCLFSLPDDWDHVMLVSHNPGITQFAGSLTKLYESLPTSAILSLTYDIPRWLNLYTATPVHNFLISPKDIQTGEIK